jgi:hypothetical protein
MAIGAYLKMSLFGSGEFDESECFKKCQTRSSWATSLLSILRSSET